MRQSCWIPPAVGVTSGARPKPRPNRPGTANGTAAAPSGRSDVLPQDPDSPLGLSSWWPLLRTVDGAEGTESLLSLGRETVPSMVICLEEVERAGDSAVP